MSETTTHACGCCDGDLPPRDAWEARRNDPAAADRLAARAAERSES